MLEKVVNGTTIVNKRILYKVLILFNNFSAIKFENNVIKMMKIKLIIKAIIKEDNKMFLAFLGFLDTKVDIVVGNENEVIVIKKTKSGFTNE